MIFRDGTVLRLAFPAGNVANDVCCGQNVARTWAIDILPFIEQDNLFTSYSGYNSFAGGSQEWAGANTAFSLPDFEHLRKAGHTFHNGDLGSMLRVMVADRTATLRGLAESGKQQLLRLCVRG